MSSNTSPISQDRIKTPCNKCRQNGFHVLIGFVKGQGINPRTQKPAWQIYEWNNELGRAVDHRHRTADNPNPDLNTTTVSPDVPPPVGVPSTFSNTPSVAELIAAVRENTAALRQVKALLEEKF